VGRWAPNTGTELEWRKEIILMEVGKLSIVTLGQNGKKFHIE
jgi:hypothetical protein